MPIGTHLLANVRWAMNQIGSTRNGTLGCSSPGAPSPARPLTLLAYRWEVGSEVPPPPLIRVEMPIVPDGLRRIVDETADRFANRFLRPADISQ